jgi:hypothetical protein
MPNFDLRNKDGKNRPAGLLIAALALFGITVAEGERTSWVRQLGVLCG